MKSAVLAGLLIVHIAAVSFEDFSDTDGQNEVAVLDDGQDLDNIGEAAAYPGY